MGREGKLRPEGAQGSPTSAPPKSLPGKESKPKKLTPYQGKLTPYQGKRRSFEYYHCPNGEVEWASDNSYGNMNQKWKPGKTDKESEPKKLTPYQGKRRSFGHFHCSKCKKEWTSAYSWANTFQMCKTCNTAIYPHRQYELLRGEGSGVQKPHLQELCQRCIETGLPCWEKWEFKDEEKRRGKRGRNKRREWTREE